MVDTYFPAGAARAERRPVVGYALVLSASILFGINGTVTKVILLIAWMIALGTILPFALVIGSLRSFSRKLRDRLGRFR